jgi:hypothetical protein
MMLRKSADAVARSISLFGIGGDPNMGFLKGCRPTLRLSLEVFV